jgi:cytochrome P450
MEAFLTTVTAKMSDILSHPKTLGAIIVLVAVLIYNRFTRLRLPQLHLLNSRRGEIFTYHRTRFRNMTGLRDALSVADAHHKEETTLLSVAGHADLVLLPNDETTWVMKQPENVLSRHAQTNEELSIEHGTYFDKKTFLDGVGNQIITSKLNVQIGALVPVVDEELEEGFKRLWGTDTEEFREVGVYETLQAIETQVSGRTFTGRPECLDPELAKATKGWIMAFPVSAVLLGHLPKALKYLVAPLVTIPNRKHEKAFRRVVKPGIQQRLKESRQRQAASDVEKAALGPEPNDWLQWMIDFAVKNGDPHLLEVNTLAGLELLINFASIHTSSFAITHAVLDLAASDPSYIDELRDEIRTVLAEHNGKWSKTALSQMSKLDSTMRESQRINGPSPIGVLRRVVSPTGITTPSGIHLPQHSVLGVNAHSIHHDPRHYGPDAHDFKPFRFAEKKADDGARQAWATTSATYMAFGGGRAACPGRFFGAAKVKLMLAHILMDYEIEGLQDRPPNLYLGLNILPPMKAGVKVRRREKGMVKGVGDVVVGI